MTMQMTPKINWSQGDAKIDLVSFAISIGNLLRVSKGSMRLPSRMPVRCGVAGWLFLNVWHNVCGISGKVNYDLSSTISARGRLRRSAAGRRLSATTPGLPRVASSEPTAAAGESLRVCVFGAGAIGGYMGVQLARGGADVSLVARGAHLSAMRTNGLRLQIEGEEHVARLPCTDDPAQLGSQDFVIIALKAHAISGVVEKIVPLLGPETSVVTASNGLPYWFFCERGAAHYGAHLQSVDPGGCQWDLLGPERAIGCVVFPAAEVVEPGVIRHEHGHKFPIGEPGGERSPRVERLRDAMVASGLEASIRDDIRDEIWLKLWGNLCFNPVSALTLATIDQVTDDPGTQDV